MLIYLHGDFYLPSKTAALRNDQGGGHAVSSAAADWLPCIDHAEFGCWDFGDRRVEPGRQIVPFLSVHFSLPVEKLQLQGHVAAVVTKIHAVSLLRPGYYFGAG